MDNFDDIQALWKTEKADQLPNFQQLNQRIATHKKKVALKMYSLLGILILLTFVMIWVTYVQRNMMWTTLLGELLIFITIFYLFHLKYKTLSKKKAEELLSNESYLNKLKEDYIKTTRKSLQEKRIGFLIWGVAYFFFLYEPLSKSRTYLITGYSIYLLVILFFWFLYRPYMVKRQQKKTANFITEIESLTQQTHEN